MTRGWWRRNALALGVLVVLAPATAAAISFTAWNSWDEGHPTRPITVPLGSSVVFSGSQIADAQARFDGEVDGTPAGARVVSVTIEIDPQDREFHCASPTLREVSGAQRQWEEASFELDRPYDEDRVTYCDPDLRAPYTLSLDYLVPEDASGPFALEFSTAEALPEYLRLLLEP
ncbi:hypothetical protein ASD65_09665 [Microbacterium sp. Root61]|uniref:hypothetical protein n=1 Tax=Microbacterium sp. Root61 TaxID=1736570 RepID=UPI0006F9C6AC|nr:hypothetical protein [Microbacterium sp. Root61]KRA24647.1 hypothetical protein ASD65_09665 [Microbacterium sp. Root61]